MKNYKNAIIIFTVFAVLFGTYYFLGDKVKKPEDAKSVKKETSSVLKVDKNKIQEIQFLYKGGEMKFTKKDNDYYISYPAIANTAIDKTVLDNLLNSIVDLKSEKLISEGETDLEQFGLKTGREMVTIVLDEGMPKILKIGSESPSKTDYYAKLSDSSSVYTISKENAEKLLLTLDKARDKDVFKFDSQDVNNFVLKKSGVTSLALNSNGGTENTWKVNGVSNLEFDNTKIQTLIQSVLGLKIKEFVNTGNPNQVDYGLNSPSYSIEVGDKKGGRTELIIGKDKVDGKEVYAQIKGIPEVIVLDKGSLDFRDKTIADVVNKVVNSTKLDDTSEIQIIDSSSTNIFKVVSGNPDDLSDNKYYKNDILVSDNGGFEKFFNLLNSLIADDIDADAVPSGKAQIKVVYKSGKDANSVNIEFIQKSQDNYYIMKNGKYTGLVIKNQTLQPVMDAMKQVK